MHDKLKFKIELPTGWILAKLSDLVVNPMTDFVDGPFGSDLKSSEYQSNGVPVFKIQNIKARHFLDKNIQFVTPVKAEQLKRHSFKLGDIIITKLGAPLGLCCKVPEKYPYGIIVADLIRLRPSNLIINTDYLVYAINSKFIQDQFKSITKGTTRARVNLSVVRNINIPIAPLNEQLKIIEQVNILLNDLKNGKDNLETALSQLSIFRQVLLKLAFEGKLTEKWRKKQKVMPSTSSFLDNVKSIKKKKLNYNKKILIKKLNKEEINLLPNIPETWIWCRNEELLDYVTSGSRNWKKYYSKTGDLFIRTQDIKTDALSLENTAKVKLPKKIEGMRSLVEKNDLLMSITGYVGRVAIVKEKIPIAYVSQSVSLMKYVDKRVSSYIYYFFQAKNYGRTLIEKMVYGVGRQVLSLQNMKDVPICLCPIPEQQIIVRMLESNFIKCNKLERIIKDNIKKSEVLVKSILQKAFQGSLVEQNANDESADKLLRNILKEREVLNALKKRQKQDVTKKLKTIIMPAELKTVIDILQKNRKPILAQQVWKLSEYADNIDDFYAKLKEHFDKGEIIETRKGKDSYLNIPKIL